MSQQLGLSIVANIEIISVDVFRFLDVEFFRQSPRIVIVAAHFSVQFLSAVDTERMYLDHSFNNKRNLSLRFVSLLHAGSVIRVPVNRMNVRWQIRHSCTRSG